MQSYAYKYVIKHKIPTFKYKIKFSLVKVLQI